MYLHNFTKYQILLINSIAIVQCNNMFMISNESILYRYKTFHKKSDLSMDDAKKHCHIIKDKIQHINILLSMYTCVDNSYNVKISKGLGDRSTSI